MDHQATKHTIAALVENKPGVLNRVANLFRRRNFNVDSLTVGRTHKAHISRMTIVVDGGAEEVEQAGKVVARFPCGRLTDPRIWAFNDHKRVPFERYGWSGTDNIVWQHPGAVKLDAAPPPGPVTPCRSMLCGILLSGWFWRWNST